MQKIKQVVLLLVGALCLSCSGQSQKATATVQVKVCSKANNGQAFYVVAKPTSPSEFYLNDYQKIASESLYTEKKAKDAKTLVLIPGTTRTFHVHFEKEGKPLAIYFLFTKPSESWKYCFDHPNYFKHKILIEESEIKTVSSY